MICTLEGRVVELLIDGSHGTIFFRTHFESDGPLPALGAIEIDVTEGSCYRFELSADGPVYRINERRLVFTAVDVDVDDLEGVPTLPEVATSFASIGSEIESETVQICGTCGEFQWLHRGCDRCLALAKERREAEEAIYMDKLAPWKPRDLIDVQSFFWLVSGDC